MKRFGKFLAATVLAAGLALGANQANAQDSTLLGTGVGGAAGAGIGYGLGGAKGAGLVVGAKTPIVLTSRSDTAETKLASIAFAVLVALKK